METGKHYDKEAILVKVDMVKLLEDHGVRLKQNGKSYKGLCPFHADSNPSLSVDREKKVWNCFGCGEGGDSIRFVQKLKQLDFQEALEYLAEYTKAAAVARPVRRQVLKLREPDASDEAAPDSCSVKMEDIVNHYMKSLATSKEAGVYLESRGLTDKRLWVRFKLGFADGSLLNLVSSKQKEALTRLGYIRADGKEHFYGCIVFPILGENDQLAGMYGRRITAGAPAHLYLPGAHKSVFNRKASKVYDEIILTECIIDCLSLVQAGMQNVQALYGTNGFTDEHLEILKNDRVKRVILALDNDEAGKKAAGGLTEKLIAAGFNVKQLFPALKDWNEELVNRLSDKEQPAPGLVDEIKEKIAGAQELAGVNQVKELEVKKAGGKYLFTANGINYRLLGVNKTFVASLRVNIRAELEDKKYLDNADLYSARSRNSLSENLSRLFDIPEQKIENDLFAMVDWLERERDRELFEGEAAPRQLTAEEEALGMELLQSPHLFQRIVDDLTVLGYVGEALNKQLIYTAASSRKLDDPVSVLILSQSASGKSLLVETVKKLIPAEDVVAVSSLSDQALNYVSGGGLLHKFLILGEAVHSDVVEHQIREMLSNHELSRMVTTKNEKTGLMETSIIKSEVIVAAMLSSTRYDVNPENASRCFVINTDESREQTQHIHQAQRRKYSIERICEKHNDVPAIIRQHQAAQRMLKKRIICNPIAEHLAFPDTLMRTRRDHERFIDLIAAVCFLRQYQKREKEQADPVSGEVIRYIECDLEDYRIAYGIVKGILPATINNFPAFALQLYEAVRELVRKLAGEQGIKAQEVLLSQRMIREATSLNQTAIKRHMRLLVDYEYIRMHGGGRRGSRSAYSLAADENIRLLDLSMIPTPEELALKLEKKS